MSITNMLDAHCHTVASGHAYSTVMEYVREAKKKGLKLFAVTDHAPAMPGTFGEMHFMNLKIIPEMIDGIEVLSGVELNIMDSNGSIDLREGLLKKLKVVIASLHHPCIVPSPSIERNTLAVINTMKNPYVRVIGHLGDPRYPMDYKQVVAAAKETDTAIEINNASFKPSSTRFGGEDSIRQILELCKLHGVPVILGSDAHFCMDVGEVAHAAALVAEAGIPQSLILNTDITLFKKFFRIEK